jgi:cobalt-zinc-cadmium efflux system outer membrane protein
MFVVDRGLRFAFAVSSTALLLASALGAQTGPTLTEDQFVASLTDDHPAVAALRRELGEAEAALVSARTLDNPDLEVVRETPGDTEQVDVTLSWQLPHPGRRRAASLAAEAAVAAANARLAAARFALEQSLRETYADWSVGVARTEILGTFVNLLDGLATREQRRAEVGEASGLDARRLQLAASSTRAELARAQATGAAAAAAARLWAPELPADVTPELPELPPPPRSEAPGVSPRILALQAELEAARLADQLAGHTFVMPELSGGWQRQESPGGDADGPILGIAWPLPLLDRQRGDRLAARARLEAATADLALAEREVAAARAGALAGFHELRAAALAAREAAAVAPAAVASAVTAFEAGEAPLTDLLETLRAASDADLAAVELLAEALAAQRRLDALHASLPPPVPSPPSTTGDSR